MSSHANVFFSQLHEAIQIKSKVNLQMVILKELLLNFPPLSPGGHTFGGGNTKGEMWPVCHCGHLSELAVPKRGPDTHCYVLRGCLINICWLADQPRCENNVCFSPSWGKFIHLTISYDLRREVTSLLVSLLESSGAGGTEGEGRLEQSEAKQEAAESTECITVLESWNKQKQSMPITA